VPENCYLLQQFSLTDSEVLLVLGNTPTVIPEQLLYKNTTPPRSRKTIVEDLLRNHARQISACTDLDLRTTKKKKRKEELCQDVEHVESCKMRES